MTDSSQKMLCRLADVKSRLSILAGDTSLDAELTRMIELVTGMIGGAQGVGRWMLETTVIQYVSPEPGVTAIWLRNWPVVSVESVREALYEQWDDAPDLVEGNDFQANRDRGILIRVGGRWLSGVRSVRAVYTAGYVLVDAWASGQEYSAGDLVELDGSIWRCTDDVESSIDRPDADEDHWEATASIPLPLDLQEAAITQTVHCWLNRDKPGVTSTSGGGSSLSLIGLTGLLDYVKGVCRAYRRNG